MRDSVGTQFTKQLAELRDRINQDDTTLCSLSEAKR